MVELEKDLEAAQDLGQDDSFNTGCMTSSVCVVVVTGSIVRGSHGRSGIRDVKFDSLLWGVPNEYNVATVIVIPGSCSGPYMSEIEEVARRQASFRRCRIMDPMMRATIDRDGKVMRTDGIPAQLPQKGRCVLF